MSCNGRNTIRRGGGFPLVGGEENGAVSVTIHDGGCGNGICGNSACAGAGCSLSRDICRDLEDRDICHHHNDHGIILQHCVLQHGFERIVHQAHVGQLGYHGHEGIL